MNFVHSTDPTSGLSEWYAYDSLGGFHVIIRESHDSSGFVGRIIDAFTGDEITKSIASSMETVANVCHKYINKMIATGFITSL